MKVKQTKQIKYRTIIDHGNGEKISDTKIVEASYEFNFQKESYQFNHPSFGRMAIEVAGSKVYLKHGSSSLEMIYDKRHPILYQTAFGQMPLDVYLKKLDRSSSHLHIVYYLYDHSTILSKCYLMIDEINPILS